MVRRHSPISEREKVPRWYIMSFKRQGRTANSTFVVVFVADRSPGLGRYRKWSAIFNSHTKRLANSSGTPRAQITRAARFQTCLDREENLQGGRSSSMGTAGASVEDCPIDHAARGQRWGDRSNQQLGARHCLLTVRRCDDSSEYMLLPNLRSRRGGRKPTAGSHSGCWL